MSRWQDPSHYARSDVFLTWIWLLQGRMGYHKVFLYLTSLCSVHIWADVASVHRGHSYLILDFLPVKNHKLLVNYPFMGFISATVWTWMILLVPVCLRVSFWDGGLGDVGLWEVSWLRWGWCPWADGRMLEVFILSSLAHSGPHSCYDVPSSYSPKSKSIQLKMEPFKSFFITI